MSKIQQLLAAMGGKEVIGQQAYTTPGTYSWTAPAGVTSVSVVAIGGSVPNGDTSGGGGLGYKNNITVVPGNSYTVVVGSNTGGSTGGHSYFIDATTVKGGGTWGRNGGSYVGDGGGNGGTSGGYSGGGAGGYSGNGGAGVSTSTSGNAGSGGAGGSGAAYYDGDSYVKGAGGGGTGILGQGTSGAGGVLSGSMAYGGGGGSGGSAGDTGMPYGANGGLYGGGTSQGSSGATQYGGTGAVRIIWPGNLRQFPSTRTADE